MSVNPVIATVMRGGIVESRHCGAFVVSDAGGHRVAEAGTIDAPVFPRSAIKAFQCVPLIESGAAARFGFTDEEIALCCSSHHGEAEHLRVAASVLRKAGLAESDLECGAHWPHEREDVIALGNAGQAPRAIHNNCSGKHAGMLALARQLGAATSGYVYDSHPVQKAVAETITRFCDVDVATLTVGIDGCSVPTWAFPLRNMALGFARLAAAECSAGQWIIRAVRAHPFMISGRSGFDTKIMQKMPRLFIKVGAEGVYCGCIPHAGLGFALKCDDGASRGAEVAIATVLAGLDVWTDEENEILKSFGHKSLRNWRKTEVGDVLGQPRPT